MLARLCNKYSSVYRLNSIVEYIGDLYRCSCTCHVATYYSITYLYVRYSFISTFSQTYLCVRMQTAYTSLRERLDEGLHGIQRHVASYSRQLAVFLDA